MKCDICGSQLFELHTPPEEPYVYVESGLPNIYLTGIKLLRCPQGHGSTPVIPRMVELHRLIAVGLMEKPGPLLSGEVRYLRKWAGMQVKDFAAQLRISPETLSRVENGLQKLGASADKLVRAIAAAARDMKETRAVVLSPESEASTRWERIVLKATRRGWSEAA